jgi:hypothetical protein
MSIDFSAILGKQVGNAPEPKPLPSGTYTAIISELPKPVERKTKEGPKGVVSVHFAIQEAMDDVDQDLLAEAGGLRKSDGTAKTMKMDFWLTENSLFILDRFMASAGFDKESGKTYTEAFEDLVNREVTLAVEQRSYTNQGGQEVIVADVKSAVFN